MVKIAVEMTTNFATKKRLLNERIIHYFAYSGIQETISFNMT